MTASVDISLRRELAAAIVAEACSGRQTVLEQLVATAFADRVAGARTGRGFLQLALWAERTCERYGAFPRIAALLRVACPVAQDELRRANVATDSLESDLQTLDAAIATKLAELASAGAPLVHAVSDGIDEAIGAFLVRLDDNDPLSAEHSRAVSLWCRRLARRLDLREEQRLYVARGGLLHDVGKTLTPREILLAPRSLTEAEFATMRDHTTDGAAMVREVERLRPFAQLVASHHERPDGNGYPDRLRGDEISLDLRIISVADCFNAMIGRRPYRQPMSPSVALDQLVKHRETQFDPLVVEAMIDIVEHPED